MRDWLAIIVLAPFVFILLIAGLFIASSFVIWIAAILAAVLLAAVIYLGICAAIDHTKRGWNWLKALVRL